MMIVIAISTLSLLVHLHNLNTTYQKHIQQFTKQLQLDKAQKLESDKKIQELQAQVTIKAQSKAIPAVSRPSVANVVLPTVCETYRPLVAQYAWDVNTAMAIMQAESGCNPTAVSSTCDHGLMQINCVHQAAVNGNLSLLNDPATNVRVAYAIYTGSGWHAWTTYNNGSYERYL